MFELATKIGAPILLDLVRFAARSYVQASYSTSYAPLHFAPSSSWSYAPHGADAWERWDCQAEDAVNRSVLFRSPIELELLEQVGPVSEYVSSGASEACSSGTMGAAVTT